MGQCMVCEVCISDETLKCERCLLAALDFDDDLIDDMPNYEAPEIYLNEK